VVRPKLSRRDTRNTDPDESDLTQSGEWTLTNLACKKEYTWKKLHI
jgi:hypothetical protein